MTDAIRLVRRYFDAFAQGNISDALACVHPDAVWHIDGDPIVTTVGIVRGREAIRDWLVRFPTGFRPLAFSIDHLIGADAEVIALGRFRHHVVSTGALADSDYAIRFTIRDGLIARYQIFEDSLLLAQVHAGGSPMRSALINGTLYGWDDVGRGTPVIFLHGLFLDRTFWSHQVAELQESRRCVAFDLPGHGTTRWRAGLDLDGIAEDVALWLAEHGATPATLVGHSQGGMIAMRIAARYPTLVERLVLVNTSARAEYPDRLPAWQDRRTALLASDADRMALFGDLQRLKVTAPWFAAHPVDAQAELAMMARHDPVSLAKALDAAVLNRRDIRGEIGKITAPTIVLSGALDQATPAALGLEIANLIPHAQSVVLPHAAHHIPAENVMDVVSAISADQ